MSDASDAGTAMRNTTNTTIYCRDSEGIAMIARNDDCLRDYWHRARRAAYRRGGSLIVVTSDQVPMTVPGSEFFVTATRRTDDPQAPVVTLITGREQRTRVVFIRGPFAKHRDALAEVDDARHGYSALVSPEVANEWSWGTSSRPIGTTPPTAVYETRTMT